LLPVRGIEDWVIPVIFKLNTSQSAEPLQPSSPVQRQPSSF